MLLLFIFLCGNSVKTYLRIWTWTFTSLEVIPFSLLMFRSHFRVTFATHLDHSRCSVSRVLSRIEALQKAIASKRWFRELWLISNMQYWEKKQSLPVGGQILSIMPKKKGLEKRLKGLLSGQRPKQSSEKVLKAFMNKWLFTYFCLSGQQVHEEDVKLELSL